MIHKIQLNSILFLDIETVPERRDFDDLSEIEQELWTKRVATGVRMMKNLQNFTKMPEFGRNLAKFCVFRPVF